jgi:hypothetical protein
MTWRRTRTTPPGRWRSSSVAAWFTASTLEQEHEWEGAQPGLQLGVSAQAVEVGRIAAPPPPDGLQQLAVPSPQPLSAEVSLLDQRHHQEVVVAEDGAAVAALHGDPGGPVPAPLPDAAAGEEVAEEDRLHLILGEGGEGADEALVVALDVSDDEHRQGHRHRHRHRTRVPARPREAPGSGEDGAGSP